MNPANWGIVDYLQGQNNTGGAGGGGGGGGGGNWTAGFSQPQSSSGSGFPAPGPAVLGSAADNSGLGYLYYDAAQGKFVSSNPSQDPTANPNPGKSTFDANGNRVGAATDPYAQYGGKGAYDLLQSGFNTQKQGIFDSANMAMDTAAGKYNRSILDFLDSARLGQQGIDQQGAENELAKMQGSNDILGMVGRGMRSSGVMLSNKNASDSSATERIAQLYGDIGQREMSKVGNQYELGKQDVQQLQDTFNVQQASGMRNLQGSKEETVNTIVSEVGQSLSALDAKMVEASMPERIALEQEKARIKADAISKLQVYDQQLTSGMQSMGPQNEDARRQKAGEMMRAGTNLGSGMFDYTTEAPAVMQGGAPAGGNFPLFTIPRRREG